MSLTSFVDLASAVADLSWIFFASSMICGEAIVELRKKLLSQFKDMTSAG